MRKLSFTDKINHLTDNNLKHKIWLTKKSKLIEKTQFDRWENWNKWFVRIWPTADKCEFR